MDAPKAFQLTGDGACSANWGELTLWAGTPLKRLNSRVRTLDHGCLPVINYGALVDGIEYRVKAFAAPVGLDPLANLLAFVRITATNPGKASQRAAIGARVFDHEGPWRQPFFDHTEPLWWAERFIDQATWQPWKLWEPTVTVPWVPVADARTGQVKAAADAGFDDYLARSSQFWQKQLNRGAVFEVPEQKVMEMHKASLMYDLMARLDYQKGVELYLDHYWKIQHGKPIPGFDSRWIYPQPGDKSN